jgi:hypothetical protein
MYQLQICHISLDLRSARSDFSQPQLSPALSIIQINLATFSPSRARVYKVSRFDNNVYPVTFYLDSHEPATNDSIFQIDRNSLNRLQTFVRPIF